ncbi:hypothetical protein B0H11DRAFT_2162166 [Mycena galericulata]|nr:hypothetical protein B0H11DRAFT_2162166 [Mycena galericulata]
MRPSGGPLSRPFQQLAKKDGPPKRAPDTPHVTAQEQRRTDWRIVKTLVKHVWPKHDWKTRGTVVFGFGLLISSKLLNVQVPLIFKNIIDSLNMDYSAELLNAVFANIGQSAIRKVARETFEHMLSLDLRFHLSRQTGGLTRAIDRGTK